MVVSDTTLDFSSVQISSSGDGQQTVNEQKVSRNISVEAHKVVEGATIAESWTAPDGRVYTLATLNKQAAASRFHSAILTADRDVEQLIDYASHTADSPVSALRALKQAREQQIHREELNRNLMVVADGHGIKGRYDLPAIEKLLRDGLANLEASVDAADDSIRAEIQRALAQLGVQDVTGSNLVLSGSLDTAPVEFHQGWFWQRGSYELIFRDGNGCWPRNAGRSRSPQRNKVCSLPGSGMRSTHSCRIAFSSCCPANMTSFLWKMATLHGSGADGSVRIPCKFSPGMAGCLDGEIIEVPIGRLHRIRRFPIVAATVDQGLGIFWLCFFFPPDGQPFQGSTFTFFSA